MTNASISRTDREDMAGATNPAWWTKPVCWSGIRNDLERAALKAEIAADYLGALEERSSLWRNKANEFARLAKLADARCRCT